jgi:[pyruvate, water dikinase]-phosphate phosphotransferase / [pyruvate, water dikinase] kinase
MVGTEESAPIVFHPSSPQACEGFSPVLSRKHQRQVFHMHLISDATGETLNTVARAAAAYYADYQAVEHIYALVRTPKQLDRVIEEVERQPGIVLFTLADRALRGRLESRFNTLGIPCLSILDPVISSLAAYLKAESRPHIGGQHVLDAQYFKRIEALNYTMLHDDGQHPQDLDKAEVVLIGISRSSKTPTSIYLANRGIRTANIPLVPGLEPPGELLKLDRPLVVGLLASAERIAQIRRSRLLSLNENRETLYVDRDAINAELLEMRRLCARHSWPVIDVTRRSIEETAAAVINLLSERPAVPEIDKAPRSDGETLA